jgi:hypothetical protein
VRIWPRCAMLPHMKSGAAIVIGAALIAGAIAISHRYEINAHRVECPVERSPCSVVWRVDQWTGETWYCQRANNPFCMVVGLLNEDRKANP